MTDSEKNLHELIGDIKFAMLTTVDAQHQLRSRPLATLEFGNDETLRFFTSASSPKVGEIEREHQVNLSYADSSKHTYISVSGLARFSRDRAKIRELWKPMHKAWFPKGVDDPDLILIEVTPEKAEYWDVPGGKIGAALKIAKAMVTGHFDGGDHRKIDLQH